MLLAHVSIYIFALVSLCNYTTKRWWWWRLRATVSCFPRVFYCNVEMREDDEVIYATPPSRLIPVLAVCAAAAFGCVFRGVEA